MKTVSYLMTALCLFCWAFLNLVSNTLIFKQVDGTPERIWISACMLLTGIVPLCIAIWLVLSSGLFPSHPVRAEIVKAASGERSTDVSERKPRNKPERN